MRPGRVRARACDCRRAAIVRVVGQPGEDAPGRPVGGLELRHVPDPRRPPRTASAGLALAAARARRRSAPGGHCSPCRRRTGTSIALLACPIRRGSRRAPTCSDWAAAPVRRRRRGTRGAGGPGRRAARPRASGTRDGSAQHSSQQVVARPSGGVRAAAAGRERCDPAPGPRTGRTWPHDRRGRDGRVGPIGRRRIDEHEPRPPSRGARLPAGWR